MVLYICRIMMGVSYGYWFLFFHCSCWIEHRLFFLTAFLIMWLPISPCAYFNEVLKKFEFIGLPFPLFEILLTIPKLLRILRVIVKGKAYCVIDEKKVNIRNIFWVSIITSAGYGNLLNLELLFISCRAIPSSDISTASDHLEWVEWRNGRCSGLLVI